MNSKGFTLIELIFGLLLLGIILGIGLYLSGDTLATTFNTLDNVSINEIYDSALIYIDKHNISFNNDNYVCVSVMDLVNNGYFMINEVSEYRDKVIKVIGDNTTEILDICE